MWERVCCTSNGGFTCECVKVRYDVAHLSASFPNRAEGFPVSQQHRLQGNGSDDGERDSGRIRFKIITIARGSWGAWGIDFQLSRWSWSNICKYLHVNVFHGPE